MKEKRKKYVAYGSNLDAGQMALRCPTARIIGKGVIPDHELLFRGWPHNAVATVEPKQGAEVPAIIWEIGPQDERNLDIYEGYPKLYGKKDIAVRTSQGIQPVMAYTMNGGFPIGSPRQSYVNTILRGYLQAGFDRGGLMRSVEKCGALLMKERQGGTGQTGKKGTGEEQPGPERAELSGKPEPGEEELWQTQLPF